MIKERIFKALKQQLSTYVHDFKDEWLNVGLLSGMIELNNLVLDAREINKVF